MRVVAVTGWTAQHADLLTYSAVQDTEQLSHYVSRQQGSGVATEVLLA